VKAHELRRLPALLPEWPAYGGCTHCDDHRAHNPEAGELPAAGVSVWLATTISDAAPLAGRISVAARNVTQHQNGAHPAKECHGEAVEAMVPAPIIRGCYRTDHKFPVDHFKRMHPACQRRLVNAPLRHLKGGQAKASTDRAGIATYPAKAPRWLLRNCRLLRHRLDLPTRHRSHSPHTTKGLTVTRCSKTRSPLSASF